MLENSFLWIHQFCQFCQFQEIYERYFPVFLRISWDKTMIQAPSIPHFIDLGMRNLQYDNLSKNS